jgi:hypothetical protein
VEPGEAARSVLTVVMRDSLWQSLGFPGLRSHGRFWDNFRAQWRVELEKAAFQELVAMVAVSHVRAGLIRAQPDVLVRALTSGDGDDPLWRVFGYSSPSAGVLSLGAALAAYGAARVDEWPNLVLARMRVSTLPDNELKGRLMIGCVRIGGVMDRFIEGMANEARVRTDEGLERTRTAADAANVAAIKEVPAEEAPATQRGRDIRVECIACRRGVVVPVRSPRPIRWPHRVGLPSLRSSTGHRLWRACLLGEAAGVGQGSVAAPAI